MGVLKSGGWKGPLKGFPQFHIGHQTYTVISKQVVISSINSYQSQRKSLDENLESIFWFFSKFLTERSRLIFLNFKGEKVNFYELKVEKKRRKIEWFYTPNLKIRTKSIIKKAKFFFSEIKFYLQKLFFHFVFYPSSFIMKEPFSSRDLYTNFKIFSIC